jgi:hypothetical protein
MSYLSLPRIVFAGQFQADPSTVNNDPEHFDSGTFRSNYQIPGPGDQMAGGTHAGPAPGAFAGARSSGSFIRTGCTATTPMSIRSSASR